MPFTIDLPQTPAAHGVLWLEVAATGTVGAVVLDELVVAPRGRATEMPLRGRTQSMLLADGRVHAPVLPLTTTTHGRVELSEPLLIPAGRVMLRLRCGFAAAAPEDARVALTVRLTSPDGKRQRMLLDRYELRRGDGEQPLLTALLEIDEDDEPVVGILHLRADAPAGTTLWLVDAEIARP
jgi:hypothetical protein